MDDARLLLTSKSSASRRVTFASGRPNETDTAFDEDIEKTRGTVNPWGYKGALGYYSGGAADSMCVRARPLSYLFVAKRTIILIYDASLLAFFFLLRFSFFFWAELGFFLFFSFPLVLTSSLVTHICGSKSKELLIE